MAEIIHSKLASYYTIENVDKSKEGAERIARCVDELPVGGQYYVAQFLINKGIKGLKQSNMLCPVAIFIRDCTNMDVVVGGYRIDPFHNAAYGVSIPMSVRDFINRFDRGLYPQLERGRNG